MSSDGAVLDANVLVPAPLRDILLRAAEAALYRPFWSDALLEEVRRTVIRHGMADLERARRLIDRLTAAFPEAGVQGYEHLVPVMTNDPKDRHVLATAVLAQASVIVTANVRHFSEAALAPWGVVARTPDRFLVDLFGVDPTRMVRIIHEQAAPLRHPPLTADQLLTNIAVHAPHFARQVRPELD